MGAAGRNLLTLRAVAPLLVRGSIAEALSWLAMVLTAIGVPTEGLALILGVDRILDMFRTATNVVGDSTATVLMARLEGEDLRIMTDEEDAQYPDRGFSGRLDHGETSVQSDTP